MIGKYYSIKLFQINIVSRCFFAKNNRRYFSGGYNWSKVATTALSFDRPLSLSKGKVNSHYMHFVTLTSTSSASGFIQMLTVCITSNNTVQMKEPWVATEKYFPVLIS